VAERLGVERRGGPPGRGGEVLGRTWLAAGKQLLVHYIGRRRGRDLGLTDTMLV
jgi:hypothetical protein